MKGIAVQLPDEIVEAVDDIADGEHEGNRNEAIHHLLEKGFELEERKQAWEDASLLTRIRWAIAGNIDHGK